MPSADPITLELYRHRFAGIAEEMGVTLRRTSYSPNIKERLDYSCALFDSDGRMVAQAAHIPVHLGAMPASVAAALAAFDDWSPGDVVLLNDPYAGGSHLPDITMISPVFLEDRGLGIGDRGSDTTSQSQVPSSQSPSFFIASRAHHADVGGMSPGSLPLSTEIYQEGIIIPPVKVYKARQAVEGVLALILRNVRTPDERQGDLAAQRAAHAVGEARLLELVERFGGEEVRAYAGYLLDYSERLTRAAIRGWPDGVYTFEDVIEFVQPEGVALTPIRVTATIAGETIAFDFTGTADAIHASLNAPLAVTQSACYYVVRALTEGGGDGEIPVNSGCFAPVTVTAPFGCLVNAQPPSAVAGGNVETSQRVTDVVLGALAQALPDRVAAAGQGTMNNCTMGGKQADGSPWAYYETLGGGMGAHPDGDGLSGAHVHMSNTLNTPVEALEMAYPLRLVRYELRRGSGGSGKHRGGDGLLREYELLGETTVTVLSERRVVAPWGLAGGKSGATGRNTLIHPDGREEELPGKFSRRLAAGSRLRIETPGGGGWGE
ncbi:MAG: hydantoinase B/oxoprolinase family protein [Caldilineaceae bacterium]